MHGHFYTLSLFARYDLANFICSSDSTILYFRSKNVAMVYMGLNPSTVRSNKELNLLLSSRCKTADTEVRPCFVVIFASCITVDINICKPDQDAGEVP